MGTAVNRKAELEPAGVLLTRAGVVSETYSFSVQALWVAQKLAACCGVLAWQLDLHEQEHFYPHRETLVSAYRSSKHVLLAHCLIITSLWLPQCFLLMTAHTRLAVDTDTYGPATTLGINVGLQVQN